MRSLRVFIVVATGVVFLVGLVCVAAAGDDDQVGANWDEFQRCKILCNEMYGGVDIMPPPVTGGAAVGYANCVQECERKYWKAYDSQFKDK